MAIMVLSLRAELIRESSLASAPFQHCQEREFAWRLHYPRRRLHQLAQSWRVGPATGNKLLKSVQELRVRKQVKTRRRQLFDDHLRAARLSSRFGGSSIGEVLDIDCLFLC